MFIGRSPKNFLVRLAFLVATFLSAALSTSAAALPGDWTGNSELGLVWAAGSVIGNGSLLTSRGTFFVFGTCPALLCVAGRPSVERDERFAHSYPGAPVMPLVSGATETIDGKAVFFGVCSTPTNGSRGCLLRLSANGSVDSSYGTDPGLPGRVLANIRVQAISGDRSGRVIVGGRCVIDAITFLCLARHSQNGEIDPSFSFVPPGTDPAGTVPPGVSVSPLPSPIQNVVLTTMVVDVDQRIVAGGICTIGDSERFCVVRFDSTGRLDQSFGTNGVATAEFSSARARVYTVLIQPDGKIVAAGLCAVEVGENTCLARFNQDGSLDPRFNRPSAGTLLTSLRSSILTVSASSAALQADGKILLLAECANRGGCLARYNSDGSLDTTFGSDSLPGVAMFPIYPPESLQSRCTPVSVWETSRGNIVLGGKQTYESGQAMLCAAFLEGGPQAARNCAVDVDGDGRYSMTDALILTRVALGFSGAAVTLNAGVTELAQRQDWDAIRKQLASHCNERFR